MEKLELELGVEEYTVPGGGVLRFHPADPGLYGRFVQAEEQLVQVEAELLEKGKEADPETLLALMLEADKKAKDLLNQVFGGDNDFHKALNGISLMAVCPSGKTVAQSLLGALADVLEKGAQRLVDSKLAEAKRAL
jgi:hypothetical protein